MLGDSDVADEQAVVTCEVDIAVDSATPADDLYGAYTTIAEGSPLVFRNYRWAASPNVRRAMIAQDAQVPERVLLEIKRLQKQRISCKTSLSLLIPQLRQAQTQVGGPAQDECERLSAAVASCEERLHQIDYDTAAWCDRMQITLCEGDYFVTNDTVASWVRCLYAVAIEDSDLIFRSIEAWLSVVECLVEVGRRRVDPRLAPSLCAVGEAFDDCCGGGVDWRRLDAFIAQVFHLPISHREVPSLKHVQEKVRSVILKLSEVVAEHFSSDCLEGLWDRYAPHFRPDSTQGIEPLAYLVTMAPRFQVSATVEQRACLMRLLDLLLVKSVPWHQTSASWAHFTWILLYKLTPVALVYLGQDPVDLDAYAEPLFSSMLFYLRLPVGDSDVRRGVRIGGKSTIEMLMPVHSSSSVQKAQGILSAFLPANTLSPLWNQLRRLIRATEVFLRPTASVHQGSQQLMTLLRSLIGQMLYRVDRQNKLKSTGMSSTHFLPQSSVDEFVRILLPPMLSALYSNHKWVGNEAQSAMQFLCRLSPCICFPEVVRHCTIGLSAAAEPHQATISLELLGNACPELLLTASTIAECSGTTCANQSNEPLGAWDDPTMSLPVRLTHFLHSISDEILPKIDSNEWQKAMLATRIVFQSAVYFNLRGICIPPPNDSAVHLTQGDKECEQSFMLSFVDRQLALCSHCDGLPRKVLSAYFVTVGAVIASASNETVALLADRICRKAVVLGQNGSLYPLCGLLQCVARHASLLCLRRLMPIISAKLSDPLTNVIEVRWFSTILVSLLQCLHRVDVFALRSDVVATINTLLVRLTSRERVHYAGTIYEAFVSSLLRPGVGAAIDPQPAQPQPGDALALASSTLPSMATPLLTPKQLSFSYDSPIDEHVAYCVHLSNTFFTERLEDLADMEATVVRRQAMRVQFLGNSSGTAMPGDDDEPLNVATVRRHTLRWLRSLVDINFPLFAADTTTAAFREYTARCDKSLPACHVINPRASLLADGAALLRLPDGGNELAVHSDAIIEAVLCVIPTIVGGENYVAMDQPPSTRQAQDANDEGQRPLCSGSGDADVKALRYCLKVLCSLCNVREDADASLEPTRVLFENWRMQFQAASGTRRMPAYFWLLSARLQDYARRSATSHMAVSRRTVVRIARVAQQLSTHHRYIEVQDPARLLLSGLLSLTTDVEDLQLIVDSTVEDLKALSTVAARLVALGTLATTTPSNEEQAADEEAVAVVPAPDAPIEAAVVTPVAPNHPLTPVAMTSRSDASKKRFDHEINGILHVLHNATLIRMYLAPSATRCLALNEILLEFPDVLLQPEEALRKSLFRLVCSERMFLRSPGSTVLPLIGGVVERALRLAPSIPSRASRWLEFVVSLWPPTFHRCESMFPYGTVLNEANIQHIFKLSVNDHIRLRANAQHVLLMTFASIKSRVPKHRVPLDGGTFCDIAGADGYAALQVERVASVERIRIEQEASGRRWYGMRHVGQWIMPSTLSLRCPEATATVATSIAHVVRLQVGMCATPQGTTADNMQQTWAWRLATQFKEDSKQYKSVRMHFWKLLSRVCDPAVAVAFFRQLGQALLKEWTTETSILADGRSNQAAMEKAKESHQGLIVVLSEMCGAAIRASKYAPTAVPPSERTIAMHMLSDLILLIVDPHVSHESLSAVQRGIMDLRDVLSANEVEVVFGNIMSTLVEHLNSVHSPSGGNSQGCIRLLTLVLQLLNTFSYDIMASVLPIMLQRMALLRQKLLGSPLTQIRNHCASVIRQILHCAWYDRNPLLLPAGSTSLTLQLETYATSLLEMTLPAAVVAATWAVPQGTANQPDTGVVVAQDTLYACKANAVLWAYPAVPILQSVYDQLLKFFACVLDIRLTEQDDLTANVNGSLVSIAFSRVEKSAAQQALTTCADILLEVHPFGRGRNAKLAICRTLRVLLFINLHRIGKYATMQLLCEAALKTMENVDKRVRSEGKTLFSIIVRVASAEQIGAIVKDLLQRLKSMESLSVSEGCEVDEANSNVGSTASPTDQAAPTAASAINNKGQSQRLAVCVALCGAVLADPDTVPPYVPRVLERLAQFARDRNPDVSSTVRQTLLDWWSSHRDKWAFAHKQHFSAAQLNVLTELFTAPSYYV